MPRRPELGSRTIADTPGWLLSRSRTIADTRGWWTAVLVATINAALTLRANAPSLAPEDRKLVATLI